MILLAASSLGVYAKALLALGSIVFGFFYMWAESRT